jgi:predicted nucleic acid-binding protein
MRKTRVIIFPLAFQVMTISGDLLAYLSKTGRGVGVEDLLIASGALSTNCV